MSPLPTTSQVSSGGVAYRHSGDKVEVALILVAPHNRWQLPKDSVNKNESLEDAALREVREETGLDTGLIGAIDSIEYWFYVTRGGQRTRFHKQVHFYLLRFQSGDVANHDHEVVEARWFEIDAAIEALAFDSEKNIMRRARERILTEPI